MKLQVMQEAEGQNTGVFMPIDDWNALTQQHQDLKTLVNIDSAPKPKLSELAGKLSHETAEAMLQYVAQSRNEWEERLNKQF